jgi:hypothetical protein
MFSFPVACPFYHFDRFVPFDAIEGVKVHKVIPRPTALRAVGKKGMKHFISCPPATSEAGASRPKSLAGTIF